MRIKVDYQVGKNSDSKKLERMIEMLGKAILFYPNTNNGGNYPCIIAKIIQDTQGEESYKITPPQGNELGIRQREDSEYEVKMGQSNSEYITLLIDSNIFEIYYKPQKETN